MLMPRRLSAGGGFETLQLLGHELVARPQRQCFGLAADGVVIFSEAEAGFGEGVQIRRVLRALGYGARRKIKRLRQTFATASAEPRQIVRAGSIVGSRFHVRPRGSV